jgi:hypothetical protein
LAIISGELLAGPNVASTRTLRERGVKAFVILDPWFLSVRLYLFFDSDQPWSMVMSDINQIDDKVAAAAFRRLVRHLRHRSDAQNIDLMGLAGFCRNCLSEWVEDASEELGAPISREEAREAIYGMPYAEWKAKHQPPATEAQLARMQESLARNPTAEQIEAQ